MNASLLVAIAAVSACVVLVDARRRAVRQPVLWAVGVFLCWIGMLPASPREARPSLPWRERVPWHCRTIAAGTVRSSQQAALTLPLWRHPLTTRAEIARSAPGLATRERCAILGPRR